MTCCSSCTFDSLRSCGTVGTSSFSLWKHCCISESPTDPSGRFVFSRWSALIPSPHPLRAASVAVDFASAFIAFDDDVDGEQYCCCTRSTLRLAHNTGMPTRSQSAASIAPGARPAHFAVSRPLLATPTDASCALTYQRARDAVRACQSRGRTLGGHTN